MAEAERQRCGGEQPMVEYVVWRYALGAFTSNAQILWDVGADDGDPKKSVSCM